MRCARSTAARVAGAVLLAVSCAPGCRAEAGTGWYSVEDEEEEIAPFRLTGVDGYAQLRYVTDDTSSAGGQVAGSSARQSILLEEVFLVTHSYVYHPSLLLLDIGGGPVFEQSGDDFGQGRTQRRRRSYNVHANATVLRDKPYTGSVFYHRANQTQSLGPSLSVLTVNTREGVNLGLRAPVTPWPARLELTRTSSRGEGSDQVIDDRVDQMRFTLDAAIGTAGTTNFQYLGTRQRSASGSADLPLQASRFRDDLAMLDARLKLGPEGRYELTGTMSVDRSRYRIAQGGLNRLDTSTAMFDLRARVSDDVQASARYQFNHARQDDDSSTVQSASAAATVRLSPWLTGSAGARAETTRGNRLDANLFMVDGSALAQQPVWIGQGNLSYTFAASRRDQEALASDARVVGEHVTLAGTRFVTLGRPQVVAGSVTVSNLARTQEFVEGVDYLLEPLGLGLRIQRLVGGNILDGQELLVDYAFLTGGTFAIDQLEQTLGASWSYRNYLNVFARWLHVAPRLTSGTPTSPINPVRAVVYGARSDVPLTMMGQVFTVGASVERERRREEILPYRRSSNEAYAEVQLPFVAGGTVRATGRQLRIDYDNVPDQSVRLRGRDLRLFAQVGLGLDVSLDATRERDTGGPSVREHSLTSLKAQWRRRKLSLSFALTRTVDTQGGAERRRTYGQLTLRRDL